MYEKEISLQLDKIFIKLAKKNKKQIEIIDNKISQILENPLRFKNLTGDMCGIKRVHIDKHFVLTFEVDVKNKIVRFLDYEHHDKIYEN